MKRMLYIAAGLGSLVTLTTTQLNAQDASDRMYLNFDGGPSFLQEVGIDDTQERAEFDTGLRTDITFGYRLNESLAAEFETGLLWHSIDQIGAAPPPPAYYQFGTGDLYQIPFLANLVYTVADQQRVSPYFGIGAGGVVGLLDADFGVAGGINDSDIVFACQAFAGVRFHLSDRTDLGLAYKFLGTTGPEWSDSGLTLKTNPLLSHSVVFTFSVDL